MTLEVDMADPRNLVVKEGEIATYHAWSRCVQQEFLMGNEFDHRRYWLESLISYQTRIFAVDLADYTILENHFHVMPRTRPDLVATWSDKEVAWRWKMAWPAWTGTEWMRDPTDREIEQLLRNSAKLVLARTALSSLSWFIARIKEPISKMANAESNRRGHFWDGRFGCRELVDEAGSLTCLTYLDLNQIKAGSAASLEESEYSAIRNRLIAWQQREALASLKEFNSEATADKLEMEQMVQLFADCHLAPISDDAPLLLAREAIATSVNPSAYAPNNEQMDEEEEISGKTELADESANRNVCESHQNNPESREIHRHYWDCLPQRNSDNTILSMPLFQYVDILQYLVDRHLNPDRVDLTPEVRCALQSNHINAERWVETIAEFEKSFFSVVGCADLLDERINDSARHWFKGIRRCRDVFN